MRLFSKVFFSITAILCVSLALSGYLLMSASLSDAVTRETSRAADTYRMTRYLLQSALSSKSALGSPDEEMFAQAVAELPHMGEVTVFDESGDVLYSERKEQPAQIAYEAIDNTSIACAISRQDGRAYLTAAGFLDLADHRMYLAMKNDITAVITQTDKQMVSYRVIYLIVCAVALLAVASVSLMIVRPIGRAAKSASEIAKGNYHARVRVTGDDELGDLARAFNTMAHSIDRSVEALENNAREKEDFVGNFAHELKTPLTSVIGYADMMAQGKMEERQVKDYAQYILEEGLRLEALSYKLMELIVLNKQDFVLETLFAPDIIANAAEGVRVMTKEKGITFRTEAEEAYLRVEFDLFKTMLLNLIDNAAKADATTITVSGFIAEEDDDAARKWETRYLYAIEVRDNGRGMPEEALKRITEAFYMVDKSRSRAQHGAGLGLALVKRIAHIHHASLTFESREREGTCARIVMPLRREDLVT